MFQRQLILKHRQTPATFCHQPLGPTSPRALLSSQSPRQRGMFLAPPEMGLLQILPAAMQTHADESALTVGVRESGTVSYLAPTHQPGQGLQPVLLQPLNPHFCACTSSKHCPVSPTDPPVEVLLTDGRHVGWTCPMEQEPLIHLFRFIELLHLQLLPRDRTKKKKKKTCYPGSNEDNFPAQVLLLLGHGGTVTQTTLSGVTACFALLLVPCCTAGFFQQNKKFSASLWTVSPTTSYHMRE